MVKNNIPFLAVLALAILGIAYGFTSSMNAFAIVGQGDTVFRAQYSSIVCAPCFSGTDNLVNSLSGSGQVFEEFSCGIKEAERTSPSTETNDFAGYYPKDCQFRVETQDTILGIGETFYAVCDSSVNRNSLETQMIDALGLNLPGGENIVEDGCGVVGQLGDGQFENLPISDDSYLFVATEVPTDITASAEPFCLIVEQSNNKLSAFSTCERAELVDNVKDYPENIPNIVPIGNDAIQNVVTAYLGSVNNVNVVTHPSTGQSVYLTRFGGNIQSCMINQGEDNGFYVVEPDDCNPDGSFVCLPSEGNCLNGVDIVEAREGAECTTSGEFVIEEEVCELVCNEGIYKQEQCRAITDFTKPVDIEGGSEGNNDLLIGLAILGFSLMVAIGLVMAKKNGKI